jgi:hypothetical protein
MEGMAVAYIKLLGSAQRERGRPREIAWGYPTNIRMGCLTNASRRRHHFDGKTQVNHATCLTETLRQLPMLYRAVCDLWVIMNGKSKDIFKISLPILRHYIVKQYREAVKA